MADNEETYSGKATMARREAALRRMLSGALQAA